MPFCETTHGTPPNERTITAAQWDHIFEKWIKRAVDSFGDKTLVCKRSPARPGNFIKGIVGDLANDDWVIADLTGQRPNVYYELGVRHALRVGTVIITQELSALPSDLQGYYAFEYSYSEKDFEYEFYFAKFQKKLHELFESIAGIEDFSDNPVSDFLGIRHQLLEKTAEQEKKELHFILNGMKKELDYNSSACADLQNLIRTREVNAKKEPILLLDVFPIEALYARLISYEWKGVPAETVEGFGQLLMEFRRDVILLDKNLDRIQSLGVDEINPDFLVILDGLFSQVQHRKTILDEMWGILVKGIDDIKVRVSTTASTDG